MIGITADADVAAEFKEINALTSRATWSNICRPAMRTMANIVMDPAKLQLMKRNVPNTVNLFKNVLTFLLRKLKN